MIIGIIGAGAAGLMAAATIIELAPAATVYLIEKNRVLGRKVSISGGGRCNVTTGVHNIKDLLTRYPRGYKFLTTAMYHFGPEQVYSWFEDHGVPLKTEADLRVFPQSNIGTDVVAVFERLFHDNQVQVLAGETAQSVTRQGDQFHIAVRSRKNLAVDKLILTTGGQAHRYTGSTGDGYKFAEQLGHTITPLAQSLNAFILADVWVKQLAGVSFVAVGLQIKDKKQYHFTGPIVCTHQGISGPAVFALSSQIAFERYSAQRPLTLLIDLLPTVSGEQLRHELLNTFKRQPQQKLRTTLHAWLPNSVIAALLGELNLPATKTNGEVSHVMMQRIIDQFKKCPVSIIGRGSGDEFVTAGGVDLTEVNPRTMESKLCPGLFFAGEILNIDGYTGGFNLQAAWATGRLAGEHCLE